MYKFPHVMCGWLSSHARKSTEIVSKRPNRPDNIKLTCFQCELHSYFGPKPELGFTPRYLENPGSTADFELDEYLIN